MIVRLVPYRVRECKQAGSNRWIRERKRDITSQTRKEGKRKNNSITYHARHGSIDDDVRGDVQVCDALSGVDHGQPGALLVAGVQVKLNLLACLAV